MPFPRTKFLNINASRPMYEISPESRQYIEDNFHIKKEENKIVSNTKGFDSIFENKYKPRKWTFITNYRGKQSPTPVFANEITVHQYELIAKEKGFYGDLPQQIKRESVANKETLSLTEGKHGEELYNIFFEKTPNGKSTKRIMDNFGLRATAVRRVDYDENHKKHDYMAGAADFYIDIVPVNPKVTTK